MENKEQLDARAADKEAPIQELRDRAERRLLNDIIAGDFGNETLMASSAYKNFREAISTNP